MENEHIKKYIENFIYDTNNPKFALFIKGDWGCGKTHLMNNLVKKLDSKKITDKEILSISLYGVESLSQINDKIYQAYHPILSSPEFQFAGRILSSALKLSTTIDLNNDGKSDGSISFGGINSKKKIKVEKIKKKLLIIDDIERCNLPLSTVLGYFSEYILQDDIKTIFIGNENETKDESEKHDFKTVKEKIIGLEFTVKPEIENAIDSFLKELSLEKYNQENNLANECMNIINILKINNMRNIRQGLYNLKYLLDIIPDSATESYLMNIVRIYMIIFLQKCTNSISVSDVNDAIIAFEKFNISFEDFSNDRDKYSTLFLNLSIPLDGLWPDIVFNGKFVNDVILDKYTKDNLPEEEIKKNELLYIISEWRQMNEEEFTEALTSLNQKFYNFEYPFLNQILHYANIMLCFSNWSLIPESESKIKEDIIQFIKDKENEIMSVPNDGFLSFSYGGYALSDNTPGLSEIKVIALEINKKNEIKNKIKELESEINSLTENTSMFCKNIYHVNGSGKYYKIPILSKIDIDLFLMKILELKPDDQRHIFYALSERYGLKYSNGTLEKEYFEDYEPLKEFQSKYESNIGEVKYNPQKVIMKTNNDDLKKLLEYMKEQVKK